jgi:putative endopeptidase
VNTLLIQPNLLRLITSLRIMVIAGVCCVATAAAEEPEGLVSGIDQSIISDAIRPGEDFYQYGNAGWLEATEIPPDRADYGIFAILDDQTQEQVRAIIDEVAAMIDPEPESAEQKVGDFYRSYVDLDARNRLGIAPLKPLLEKINKIDDHDDLATVMGELHRSGIGAPLATYVSVDARSSEAYTVYVTQFGLTLPDRDYYLVDDPRFVELRQELVKYAHDLLASAEFPTSGDSTLQSLAAGILKIEATIAHAQWTKTENRDPERTYNRASSDELQEMTGPFSWAAFRESYGIDPDQPLVVRQPSYFTALGQMWEHFDVQVWKAYLTFRTVDAYAGSLSEGLERRQFAFHGTAVSGVDEQRPLWQRAVRTTGSVLGELVGQLYVERHFAPEAKERMSRCLEIL